MLTYLRDTNPADKWLRQRFQTHLALANGQHIVLRYDLASAGMWNTEKVCTHLGHAILADKESNYGEYLSVATTIADVLNQRMLMGRDEIIGHARLSLSVLDALQAQNMSAAYLLAGRLGIRLLEFEPLASEIWSMWVHMVFEVIKSDGDTGFNLDTVV